ncbi:MAG: alkene reductase [Neisseriaceae bacterium]|nr:alkene reductase [Neisseriaceae bacterium]
MHAPLLLQPLKVGNHTLKNRIFLAPLTRLRNTKEDLAPTDLAVEYYSSRASGGLLIAEATNISATGAGYAGAPGIYSDKQIKAWSKVTQAVHEKQGVIALQIWHTGRISHKSLLNGEAPWAPSSIQAVGNTHIYDEKGELKRVATSIPREIPLQNIAAIVADYAVAAKNAVTAGFDFVEIHGAHGYLIDQFLNPQANIRKDQYGGSITNRSRFLFEVVDAVVAAIGANRTGIRISPFGDFNGNSSVHEHEMADYMIKGLSERGLAFLHISEPDWAGALPLSMDFRQKLRKSYLGIIIGAGAYNAEKAQPLLAAGLIDAVAFGRSYLANPDLPERLAVDAPLNALDLKTLYGGGKKGYIDYPTLA